MLLAASEFFKNGKIEFPPKNVVFEKVVGGISKQSTGITARKAIIRLRVVGLLELGFTCCSTTIPYLTLKAKGKGRAPDFQQKNPLGKVECWSTKRFI